MQKEIKNKFKTRIQERCNKRDLRKICRQRFNKDIILDIKKEIEEEESRRKEKE